MERFYNLNCLCFVNVPGADKSFARPQRKQARKHVRRRARFRQHRDARCLQDFFSCKARRRRNFISILKETLGCFFSGWADNLPAPLWDCIEIYVKKFTPFWQKHWLVTFLVGLRTYQHPCNTLSTCKAPKEIHAILTETLASFLPGRAKDLSAPL